MYLPCLVSCDAVQRHLPIAQWHGKTYFSVSDFAAWFPFLWPLLFSPSSCSLLWLKLPCCWLLPLLPCQHLFSFQHYEPKTVISWKKSKQVSFTKHKRHNCFPAISVLHHTLSSGSLTFLTTLMLWEHGSTYHIQLSNTKLPCAHCAFKENLTKSNNFS